MNVWALAKERGFIVQEANISIGEGRTRPGWFILDVSSEEFVHHALDFTSAEEVEAYIYEASGDDPYPQAPSPAER